MHGSSGLVGIGMSLLFLTGGPVQAEGISAQAVIQQATERMYAALQEKCTTRRSDPEALLPPVTAILMPHADFKRMSRWVMGKHWKQLSESQRQRFQQEFKKLLIRTYATVIHSVSPDGIRYLPQRKSDSVDTAVVRTEVQAADTPVIPVHYLMHRKNGHWLVYDVRIEGVSLITNYRSTFSAGIEAQGVGGLIASLKQKNQQPMAAARDKGHTAVVTRC